MNEADLLEAMLLMLHLYYKNPASITLLLYTYPDLFLGLSTSMERKMRIFIASLAAAFLSTCALGAEYKTRNFREMRGDDRLPVVYICAVIGVKTGMEPKAMQIVAAAIADVVTADQSEDLLSDALTWWEQESSNWNVDLMWEEECNGPIDNLRRLYFN